MNSWTEMIFLPQLRLRIHIIMSGGLFLFVYLSGGSDWGGGDSDLTHTGQSFYQQQLLSSYMNLEYKAQFSAPCSLVVNPAAAVASTTLRSRGINADTPK